MTFLDSQGRAVSSCMQGREDIQMENRRDLLICSTPIRAKRNRSRLSQISRPSLRFSGPRSPGVSPVSLSTSYVGDYFSDADDFVEPNRSELDPQISTHHNNRSRRNNRPQNFQAKMQEFGIKEAVLKLVPKACVSQRIERYKPLEIQSDSEEEEMSKRAKSRKKDSKKNVVISNSVYRKPIKGYQSHSESLDSGKGTDEAQMSIPATTSSKVKGFEESDHEYNVEVGLRRDLQKEMYAGLNSRTNFSSRKKSPRRLSNRKIANQRQDSGVSEIHGLTKNNLVDFVSSIQWKSGPAGYEPLVVVSDEEEEAVKKKGPNRPSRKCKANYMSTCDENQKKAAQKTVLKWPNEGRKILKDVVVNASFDDYEDDKDEESMEERVRNLSYHGSILEEAEDEYSGCAYVSQRLREEQRQNSLSKEASLSDDESCVSTHSHVITKISKGPSRIYDEGDNVEDVLNDSFCSDDKDLIYSGSVLVNHNDYAQAREREHHLQNRESYQSAINKSGCRNPCTLNYDEEKHGFYEDSGEFDDEMDMSEPLRDISHRISGTLQEASDGEEVEALFNTSGPVNRKSHSIQIQFAAYSLKFKRNNSRKGIANRTVSHSCRTESFEESEKPVSDSVKKRGKATTKKKPSPLVGKTEGPAKKKRTRSPVASADKAVAKPVKRNAGKKKAKLQESSAESSDNSPHEKTSGTESRSMIKKMKNRINKSPASSGNASKGKGTARKRKCTGEGVAKESEGTPEAKSGEEEGSEIATSSTKAGAQEVVRRKRGRPHKSSPTKSTRRKGSRKDANKQIEEQLSEDSSKPKVASKQKGRSKKPCENVPANHRSLHNPNKSKGLSFNNEENNSGNKSDSQHPFSPHPLIVRKNHAESSSDYLRKKVLTMRLGKSVCQKSLIDDEERLVTSTPLKPSSSRINLNSSNKMPDVEIVIAGSTEKSNSQMIVKDSEVNKIKETVGKIPNEGEAPKELQESKVSDPNREVSNKKETEKTFISQKHLENITSVDDDISQIEKETLSEGKKSIEVLETVKPAFERFTVNKILSDWPADEIHATSNEKLKNLPSSRNKMNVLVNGKEKELEVFVEHSQIKFHKHKKQNIQYGPAINTSGYGSGFVHFTPGSDKGVSHAKKCNFIYLVLEGLVEVSIHESERLCKPGDFIVIPKGSKYNITGRGDKVSALAYFKCQGD